MLRSHTESVRGGAYTPVRRHCLLRSSSALACVRHMQHVQTRLAKAACLNMMTLMWHTLSRSCSGCRCAPARPSVISAGAVERLPSSRRRAAAERLGWPTRRTRHTSGRLFRGGSWRSGWLPGCLACAARQRSDTSCVACRASSEAEFTARRAPQVRTAEYAVCRSFAACGQQGLLCSGAVPPCMADLQTLSQDMDSGHPWGRACVPATWRQQDTRAGDLSAAPARAPRGCGPAPHQAGPRAGIPGRSATASRRSCAGSRAPPAPAARASAAQRFAGWLGARVSARGRTKGARQAAVHTVF